jgi:hypothetical protein
MSQVRQMSRNLWVVDYDIPVDDGAKRRAFYRALHDILDSRKIVTGKRSTQSVWIIDNEEIAREIHNLASSYGTSNMYTATPVV